MSRLTKEEKRAIVSVLHEKIAGGWEDLRDALGLSDDEAEQTMALLESAVSKLTG